MGHTTEDQPTVGYNTVNQLTVSYTAGATLQWVVLQGVVLRWAALQWTTLQWNVLPTCFCFALILIGFSINHMREPILRCKTDFALVGFPQLELYVLHAVKTDNA